MTTFTEQRVADARAHYARAHDLERNGRARSRYGLIHGRTRNAADRAERRGHEATWGLDREVRNALYSEYHAQWILDTYHAMSIQHGADYGHVLAAAAAKLVRARRTIDQAIARDRGLAELAALAREEREHAAAWHEHAATPDDYLGIDHADYEPDPYTDQMALDHAIHNDHADHAGADDL